MSESAAGRAQALGDPVEQRAIIALIQSVVLDLAAIKLAHNTHQHSALNAVPSVALVGNLNTTN